MKELISVLIIFLFLLPGCGKKGPPAVLRQEQPPAIDDLRFSLNQDILTLTWTIPKGTEKLKSTSAGFIVYRSKRPISDSDCKNCPKLFMQMADIPINAPGFEKKNIEYSEEIEKGFIYTYKVVLYTKSGVSSADFNYIEFNY